MNSQINSKRRLAMAALLMVLSASAVLGQVNKTARFKGSFDGRDSLVVQGGTGLGAASGAGTASYIGRFTYTSKATVDLATGLSTGGVIQLVVANGDVINGSFVGRGEPPNDTPNVGHIVELVAITGGTGHFQGATGSFTLDRLFDQTTLPAFAGTSGTLKGSISTPGSTK